MAYEDLKDEDRTELERLRKLLYRAVIELEYIHTFDGLDGYENMITTSEGKAIVVDGMKLLGVADLSEEELPMRLLRA